MPIHHALPVHSRLPRCSMYCDGRPRQMRARRPTDCAVPSPGPGRSTIGRARQADRVRRMGAPTRLAASARISAGVVRARET